MAIPLSRLGGVPTWRSTASLLGRATKRPRSFLTPATAAVTHHRPQMPARALLPARSVWTSRTVRTSSDASHTDLAEGITRAPVIAIENATPTIKMFSLEVPRDFEFEAGQWLDMFLPGLETIGGFSLANGPHHTTSPDHPAKTLVQVAVKLSGHPPAQWMHEKIDIGSELGIRVGGECVLVEGCETTPSLFIAGGIGVAPLHSMLQERLAWLGDGPPPTAPTLLLYSVSTQEELLFVDSLSNMARSNPRFSVRLFFSQPLPGGEAPFPVYKGFPVIGGRITHAHLDEAMASNGMTQLVDGQEPARAYLCGPPNMVDTVEALLVEGPTPMVLPDRIHYERWW